MAICTYDNPATMRRECWENGRLLCSYDWSCFAQKEKIPAEYLFFGANIGPFKIGQLVGNKKALESHETSA